MEVDMTFSGISAPPSSSSANTRLSTSISPCDAAYSFPKPIGIKANREATAFAQSFSYQPPKGTLAIWIDSTISSDLRNKPCAIAVGYHLPTTSAWKAHVTVTHCATANEAGLLAIGEALRVAVARTMMEELDRVLVFSDALQILKSMKERSPFGFAKDRWLIEDICRLTEDLDKRGVEVELYWVPSQAKVESHQQVRCCSQRYRDLALAVCPLDSTGYNVDFPLLRLDGALATEDAEGEDMSDE